MKKEDFPRLSAKFLPHDLEWRIGRAGETNGKIWAFALAYVDARAVQERLDEVCGPANWQDSYQVLEKGILCTLQIKVDGEWIAKTNGSPETDIEGFKGGISKALVRAASSWGVGRYLYDLEPTFAHIVEKGTPGAKTGQTKDKKWFHWTPPDLPKWALPDPTGRQPTQEELQAMLLAKSQMNTNLPKVSEAQVNRIISDSQDVTPRCECGFPMVISRNKEFFYCPKHKDKSKTHSQSRPNP